MVSFGCPGTATSSRFLGGGTGTPMPVTGSRVDSARRRPESPFSSLTFTSSTRLQPTCSMQSARRDLSTRRDVRNGTSSTTTGPLRLPSSARRALALELPCWALGVPMEEPASLCSCARSVPSELSNPHTSGWLRSVRCLRSLSAARGHLAEATPAPPGESAARLPESTRGCGRWPTLVPAAMCAACLVGGGGAPLYVLSSSLADVTSLAEPCPDDLASEPDSKP